MSLLLLFLDFPFRRRVVGSCSKKAILAPVVLRLGEMNDIVGLMVGRLMAFVVDSVQVLVRENVSRRFSTVTTLVRWSTWLSETLPVD